ncbi:MAG: hypothetical protein BECKG1743E_GA0114224_106201, partial [Candidatus Kentron sp. G]
VTVIATQKLDDKDKQVGIFFDRNRLSFSRAQAYSELYILLTGYFFRFRKRSELQVVSENPITTDDVTCLDIINTCFGTSSKFYH